MGYRCGTQNKGAPSDLPAADAQYHKSYYDSFRQMTGTSSMHNKPHFIDFSLNVCINYMYENSAQTFTAVQLYDKYCNNGGKLSRKQMWSRLTDILVMKLLLYMWWVVHPLLVSERLLDNY